MNYIRPWRTTDAYNLAAALSNESVQKNLRDGIPFPYTENDAVEYIRSIWNAPRDSQYVWAIHDSGMAIGCIGLFRKDNIHARTAEIGYYIAEPYWGRGIAAKAVREACSYVFQVTNIVRVFAEPFATNTASCRVLEKAGFTLEGTLRKNAVKNGEIIDMKLYSLVKE